MGGEILHGHALEGGHRKERLAEGIAESFGRTDSDPKPCVTSRATGYTDGVELGRTNAALFENLVYEG
jgi:hypothetical protein